MFGPRVAVVYERSVTRALVFHIREHGWHGGFSAGRFRSTISRARWRLMPR